MVSDRRMDLTPLITHRFALDDINDAYDLFSRQGDGVLKVALFPAAVAGSPKPGLYDAETLSHLVL